MDNKEVQKILNKTAENLFKKPMNVTFTINSQNQLILSVNGVFELCYVKGRPIKKVKSKEIIDAVKLKTNETLCSKLILELMREVVKERIDLNKYLDVDVNIDKNIIDNAKKLLKEHISDIKQFYINPITEIVDSIDIDKYNINEVWKKEIVPKYNVVNKIDSFRSYSTIKEYNNYPSLVLECKTGSISLTENTTENFLKVRNNEDGLSKIKETERILSKCCKNIKSFIKVKDIIEINEMLNTLSSVKEYKTINYNTFYRSSINKRIKMDLVSGELILDTMVYNLETIDLNEVKSVIDNIYSEVLKGTEEYIKNEIEKRKNKFNKPHVYNILNVINDFPKKGITTYASILVGESSSKIKSNDYDKSVSYGKMSEYSNSYITNKIRDFIDEGFINEDMYKASFGRYIGLTLSKESRDYIDNYDVKTNLTNINTSEEEIKCFNTLLNRLRVLSSSKARVLLIKISETSLPFEKSDFDMLLNFIEKDRALYRDYEEVFNKCISKIVPTIYKPLFLLNSNFTSGVNKKTLKSIYELMDAL